MTIVTDFFSELILRQVEEKGVVVWFDPEKTYQKLSTSIALPKGQIARFDGSYIELRRAIDASMNDIQSEAPPRLLIYVPLEQAATAHILDEFIFAGTVMQPGEPLPRNTSLAVVAREALRTLFSRERLDEIAEEVRKGRVTTLDELDRLAEQGDSGALGLVFGTSQTLEIAQKFLFRDSKDGELVARGATNDLAGVLSDLYGFTTQEGESPTDLRAQLRKHLLITDFLLHLTKGLPEDLKAIHLPEEHHQRENCSQLADLWRKRRDMQGDYIEAAGRTEAALGLLYEDYEWDSLLGVETFLGTEMRLLISLEDELTTRPRQELINVANCRRTGFWSESDERVGARWAIVATAGELLLKAQAIQQALRSAPPSDANAYIQKYSTSPDAWGRLDTLHRNLERLVQTLDLGPTGELNSLEKLLARARREYVRTLDELARLFPSAFSQENYSIPTVLHQTEVFQRYVSPSLAKMKMAYVWVDALRYEMALDLAASLDRDWKTEILPALATPPTITPVGMAALLPGAERGISLAQMGDLAVEIGGKILKTRKDRVAYLASKIPEMYEVKLEQLVPAKKAVRDSLRAAKFILVTSQEIDLLGEGDNLAQAREFMDSALAKLARAFRVLIEHGVERIVVTADHGYIFAEELDADQTIPAPGGQTVDLHRRVWIGRGGQALEGVLRTPVQTLNLGGDFDLATPLGLTCFAAPGGKAFFHGGLSLQELVIPVMVLEPETAGQPASIEWMLVPGREKITTRFFSVQVGGRAVSKSIFEGEPPLVRVEIRVSTKVVSNPVTATYGLQDATGEIQLRWKADNPFEIEMDTIALMLSGEISQKKAALVLIDAETERILSKTDVDVAISI